METTQTTKIIKKIFAIVLVFVLTSTLAFGDDDHKRKRRSKRSTSSKIDKFLQNTHEVLSYGAMAGVLASGYYGIQTEDNYEQETKNTHKEIAKTTATIMIANTLIGLYAYREDLLDFSDGFSKEHLHAIVGLIATYLIVDLANKNYEKEDHKDQGITGAGAVGLSYVIAVW